MSEYRLTAIRIGGWSHIGIVLLMDVMHRLRAGIFGGAKAPQCLTDQAWIDAGYVIDAPEEIPGGGCCGWTMPDDHDFQLPEQIRVQREP